MVRFSSEAIRKIVFQCKKGSLQKKANQRFPCFHHFIQEKPRSIFTRFPQRQLEIAQPQREGSLQKKPRGVF